MKNVVKIGIIVALSLAISGTAYAQTPGKATTTKPRAEARAALAEKQAERIKNQAAKISEKMDGAAARLEQMLERATTLTGRFEAKGVNVTETKALIATAQAKIAAAKTKIAEAKTRLGEVPAAEKPREKMAEAKTLVEGAMKAVREAHAAIVDVIASLKRAGGSKATTTPAAAQ